MSDDLQSLPYDEWTKDELHDELAARDLPVSGSKEELIARLEESDANQHEGITEASVVHGPNDGVDALKAPQPDKSAATVPEGYDDSVSVDEDGTITVPSVIAGVRINSNQADDIKHEYALIGESATEDAIREGAKK